MENLFYILIGSVVTVVLMLIVFAIVVLLIISKITNFSKSKKNIKFCKQKKATTILIDTDDLTYDYEDNPFNSKLSFDDLQESLYAILDNKKIKKIIIDVDKTKLSPVQVEELYPIFEKLNKEKEVISIGTVFDNNAYLTAMLADKIYLENTVNSTLFLRGYFKKLCYLKPFLDKIGIEINVLHIGDYKSAGENFARSKMSENLKDTLKVLTEEKLKYSIDFIKERRKVDISADINDGSLFLNYSEKLIDGRMNKGILLRKEENLFSISNYLVKEKKNKSKNVIAVISLEGEIKKDELSYKEVEEKIDEVNEIKNLKGLVIEINSPGGSAYESSLIYSYIKENIEVPIYISMKDVCASGGYFIASTGKKLFANKFSLTGSIGVVGIYPVLSKLTKKLGLVYDGISSGVGSEYGYAYNRLSYDTEDIVLNHMNDVYKEFKGVVSKARNISDEKLESLAGGRVYTGNMAKQNCLIDDVKNINEVIEILAKDLNLENYKVEKIYKNFDLKKYLKEKVPYIKYEEYLNIPLMLFNENLF